MSQEIDTIGGLEVDSRVMALFETEVTRISKQVAIGRVMRGLVRPLLKLSSIALVAAVALCALAGSLTAGLITGGVIAAAIMIVPMLYLGGDTSEHEAVSTYRSLVFRLRPDLLRALDDIRSQASAFNQALWARQSEDEALKDIPMYEDDVAQWRSRRELLVAKTDAVLAQLEAASHACMSSVERKKEIETFRQRVQRLMTIESGLNTLTAGESYEVTRDYASFGMAAELRHQLEQERARLGLPARALPSPSKSKKLLTTAT